MFGYQGYSYQSPYATPSYMQRGYAPQPMQMPQTQQQAQPQVQIPVAQPISTDQMPIQDIKYVTKAQEEGYVVFPNTKVMLIDRENGMAHLKAADAMGQLTQNDHFRFEKVNADGSPVKPKEPDPKVNLDDFVKMEQLKEFGFVTFSEHKKVLDELEAIKRAIASNSNARKAVINDSK